MQSQTKLTVSRRCFFWLILGLVAYLFVESFSLLSLYVLRESKGIEYAPIRMHLSEKHKGILQKLFEDQNSYIQHDPVLGWSIKKNGSARNLYRANSDGIRADREYRLTPPKDVLRVASFGDSFTHCSSVSNQHTWQEYLNEIKSSLEVMNFGVGAYGLDQAFLRYQRDGKRYRPHVVLIGFMSENINRNVNVFRPFYYGGTGMPFSKPRFILQEGKNILKANPLKHLSDLELLIRDPENILLELGRHDWHFQQKPKEGPLDFLPSVRLARLAAYSARKRLTPQIFDGASSYNEDSNAFKLTLKIFDDFHESVMKEGAVPIVVLFPTRDDLLAHRKSSTNVFAPLVRYFKENKYRYVDLHEAFDTYASDISLEELFVGHYSPSANRAVAKYLADYFSKNRLDERH